MLCRTITSTVVQPPSSYHHSSTFCFYAKVSGAEPVGAYSQPRSIHGVSLATFHLFLAAVELVIRVNNTSGPTGTVTEDPSRIGASEKAVVLALELAELARFFFVALAITGGDKGGESENCEQGGSHSACFEVNNPRILQIFLSFF